MKREATAIRVVVRSKKPRQSIIGQSNEAVAIEERRSDVVDEFGRRGCGAVD
jgi:hypothetical protein